LASAKKRSRRSRNATGAARPSGRTKTRSDPRLVDRAHGRPRKRFGQHFLEPVWVTKVVDAIGPAPGDTFLEIGPGRGALTAALAPRVRRVIAVEIDRDLAAALPSRVPPNVRVVTADVLDVDLAALLRDEPGPLRVAGNLPYNVSSPILFRLLDAADEGRRFRDAAVMLQKEVADRLVAAPGSKGYGALAIQVQLLADVDRLLTLPAGAFRPAPKVTSALVRLRFRAAAADVGDRAVFEHLVRGLFRQRRKTLLNALRPIAGSLARPADQALEIAGLSASRRPETLTVAEMARLTRAVL
jgi:16S rRNA (adenine1518-N6/adenine1519-N6)-dimethyltransferase